MTPEERNLITGLFNRLQAADSTQPKDAEADQLIRQSTAAQPAAPYLLVQTLLVQEHALNNALARIKGLEQELAQAKSAQSQTRSGSGGGGGFLSGLFGHHSTPAPPPSPGNANIPPQQLPQAGQPMQYAQSAPPPFPSTMGMAPAAGGGFLRSALTTAAGVAGGALLFQGVENLLGHNAGPFGPALGGGGGFFGGGSGSGFLGGGGRPEIIENNEVINNYYDQGGGNREEAPHATADNSSANDNFTANDNFSTNNPFDAADNSALFGGSAAEQTGASGNASDPFDTSLAGNQSDALDNNYDTDNSDSGSADFFGDSSGGGSDDSSYV